jgi:hypothetical protein
LKVAIRKCWKLKAVPLICSYAACRGRYSFALPNALVSRKKNKILWKLGDVAIIAICFFS